MLWSILCSKIAHRFCTAAVNPNNQGGIGLFTNTGKLVWRSTLPLQGYFGDAYFGIDKYGNLKDYFNYKGQFWGTQFQAITGNCNLPNFCGFNSLCDNSQCRSALVSHFSTLYEIIRFLELASVSRLNSNTIVRHD